LSFTCLRSYCPPLYIEHFKFFLVGNSSIPDEKYSMPNSYKPTRPPTPPFYGCHVAQVPSPRETLAFILPYISYIYSSRLKHFYPMEISCVDSILEWWCTLSLGWAPCLWDGLEVWVDQGSHSQERSERFLHSLFFFRELSACLMPATCFILCAESWCSTFGF